MSTSCPWAEGSPLPLRSALLRCSAFGEVEDTADRAWVPCFIAAVQK
jgi:hypothetical protein